MDPLPRSGCLSSVPQRSWWPLFSTLAAAQVGAPLSVCLGTSSLETSSPFTNPQALWCFNLPAPSHQSLPSSPASGPGYWSLGALLFSLGWSQRQFEMHEHEGGWSTASRSSTHETFRVFYHSPGCLLICRVYIFMPQKSRSLSFLQFVSLLLPSLVWVSLIPKAEWVHDGSYKRGKEWGNPAIYKWSLCTINICWVERMNKISKSHQPQCLTHCEFSINTTIK